MRRPDAPFALATLDMNGTTIADNGGFEQALRIAFDSADTPYPTEAELHSLRGIAKAEMFRRLISHPDQAAIAYDVFTKSFITAVDEGTVTPISGATDALAQLHQLGIRVCLTTGFPRELQHAIITKLGWNNLVDLFVTPDDVPRGRPHPDMILYAARTLGITNLDSVVVVGDTTNDLLAGRSARAGLIVGVLTGAHTAEQLAAVDNITLIPSVANLPALLTNPEQPPAPTNEAGAQRAER